MPGLWSDLVWVLHGHSFHTLSLRTLTQYYGQQCCRPPSNKRRRSLPIFNFFNFVSILIGIGKQSFRNLETAKR